MSTSKINSDSAAEYSIPPEQFLIKLRKNLDGVALSHDALDNNWEVLRRTLNKIIHEVDEITTGSLDTETTENLYVNKIADDVIQTSHLQNGAVTSDKILDGTIVTADIKSQNITTDLIKDGAITSEKIASGSAMDFSDGISVGGVQVVDKDGNITGAVSLSDAQKVELKGEPGKDFTYGDFTQNQLQLLKGEAFTYQDFTENQLDSLKGDKGDAGPSPDFSFANGTLTITQV